MNLEKRLGQEKKVTTGELLEKINKMSTEDNYLKITGYTWYELIKSYRRLAAVSSRSQLLVGCYN